MAVNILNFIFELGQLRRIRHEGLRLAGVVNPESVASHALRAAQIGYLLAVMENYANPAEVATLLVWHDLEECRTGDLHKVANRYVKKDGLRAVIDQTEPLGQTGDAIKNLWQRVAERSDTAAIIAKDADYLEQAITAREYIEQGYQAAQNIIDNVAKALRTESARTLLNELPNVSPYEWWQGLKKLD